MEKEKRKTNRTVIDSIKVIGGALLFIYFPLLIGLIWFDFILMVKLIATNTVLVLLVRLIERAFSHHA